MGRASGGLQAELAERPEGVDTQATDRYQRPWQVKHSEIILSWILTGTNPVLMLRQLAGAKSGGVNRCFKPNAFSCGVCCSDDYW